MQNKPWAVKAIAGAVTYLVFLAGVMATALCFRLLWEAASFGWNLLG